MLEETWLQLVLLAGAGGVCAFAYLAVLRTTVFGKASDRLSLLGAIGAFIGATAGAFGSVWIVAGGRPQSILIAFGGFVVVRALLGEAMCGPCETVVLERAPEEAPDEVPSLNPEGVWGAVAADDGEGAEHARTTGPEPFREYRTV